MNALLPHHLDGQTHHSPEALSGSAGVVIDVSRSLQTTAEKSHFSATSLLEWVRTCPDLHMVHVFLPSDRVVTGGIQLQRRLLSLGCTVTRKR